MLVAVDMMLCAALHIPYVQVAWYIIHVYLLPCILTAGALL